MRVKGFQWSWIDETTLAPTKFCTGIVVAVKHLNLMAFKVTENGWYTQHCTYFKKSYVFYSLLFHSLIRIVYTFCQFHVFVCVAN